MFGMVNPLRKTLVIGVARELTDATDMDEILSARQLADTTGEAFLAKRTMIFNNYYDMLMSVPFTQVLRQRDTTMAAIEAAYQEKLIKSQRRK